MKKILLIAVLTLIPSFANSASPSDNTYIAANCNISQSGATASYCNGTTYCSTSSATSLPHYANNSRYKDFHYCTVKTFTMDGQTSKVLLCFKDQYQCYGVRACNSNYLGTKPEFQEATIATLGWGGVSNPNNGYYVTTNISNIAQFSCCYQTSGVTETSLPSGCSSSANKVAWFKPNSCTSSGTSTTTATGQYLTCKAGYYATATNASGGKYTFPSTTNPCNAMSSIGCTACPTHTSNNGTSISGTTSSTGSTSVTQCYLKTNSGATWSDTTGAYDCPTTTAPYKN